MFKRIWSSFRNIRLKILIPLTTISSILVFNKFDGVLCK